MCRIPLFKVLQDKKVGITYIINTDDNNFSIKGENYSKFLALFTSKDPKLLPLKNQSMQLLQNLLQHSDKIAIDQIIVIH